MGTVRACFFVESITHRAAGASDVTLRAVTRGERGKDWSLLPPNGELALRGLSEGAARFFTDVLARSAADGGNSEVYLTIEVADDVDARS